MRRWRVVEVFTFHVVKWAQKYVRALAKRKTVRKSYFKRHFCHTVPGEISLQVNLSFMNDSNSFATGARDDCRRLDLHSK